MTREEIHRYLRRGPDDASLRDDVVAFEAFVEEWETMQVTIGDPYVFVGIAWDWFKFGWYARATNDGYN